MTMSESSGSDLGIDGLSRAQLIGSGGFARVYRAEHLGLQSLVAVKVLQFEPDERTRERFRRECVALGQLRGHPNIVTVFDEGFTREGRPYLLMEFAPGGTLSDELVRHGAMGWPEAVEISIKLAGAVETAHRHGLLHRDIKTANVLMSAYGEPQLADFGLSRFHDTEQSRTSNITATLAYAAPELLRGEQATVATDVYALAATLATLIVGKAPFIDDEASGPLPLLRRIDNDPPPDVRTLGAPADVAAAIETGMAKSPGDRPPTALAFAELLRNVQRAHGLDLTNIRLPAPLTTSPSIPVEVLTGDEYPTTIVDRTPAPAANQPPPEPSATHTPTPTPPAGAEPEPTPRRSKLVPLLAAVAVGIIVLAGLIIQPWKGTTSGVTTISAVSSSPGADAEVVFTTLATTTTTVPPPTGVAPTVPTTTVSPPTVPPPTVPPPTVPPPTVPPPTVPPTTLFAPADPVGTLRAVLADLFSRASCQDNPEAVMGSRLAASECFFPSGNNYFFNLMPNIVRTEQAVSVGNDHGRTTGRWAVLAADSTIIVGGAWAITFDPAAGLDQYDFTLVSANLHSSTQGIDFDPQRPHSTAWLLEVLGELAWILQGTLDMGPNWTGG